MVIAPTCPKVSFNSEARLGYMDGRSVCIMSFSRWQKLMARITLNTVAPADNGVATPSGAPGAIIFSFFMGSRYDTTATENARTPRRVTRFSLTGGTSLSPAASSSQVLTNASHSERTTFSQTTKNETGSPRDRCVFPARERACRAVRAEQRNAHHFARAIL